MQMDSATTDVGAPHSSTSDHFQRMVMADILYSHLHTAHISDTLPPSEIKQTGSVMLLAEMLSDALPVSRVESSLFLFECQFFGWISYKLITLVMTFFPLFLSAHS